MAPAPKPRTAAFTPEQIAAGFWLIASAVHERRLEIDEDRTDEALLAELEPLVGAHGLRLLDVKRAIPRILAAREAAERHELPTVAAAKCDAARARILSDRGAESSKGALLWPTASRTIAVRLGGGNWNAALASLGLAPAGRGRAQGSGRFDESGVAAVLAEYVASREAAGAAATIGGYGEWARARRAEGRTDVPSAATIRQRYGAWGRALEAAAAAD
ncbi:hypothetical protein [Actinomyces culturomici]|uniref:hypothetical protein n=1 Tax=Actinomyces culturomici TaxID=1926276 RepID=UPI000E202951|nr:hypothetical protein [Actinomyces culturomici]